MREVDSSFGFFLTKEQLLLADVLLRIDNWHVHEGKGRMP